MVATRSLGGGSAADVQANRIQQWWFIKVEFAAPVGTKYFTDRPTFPADFISLDIGDGSGLQNWYHYDIQRGPLDQSSTDPINVSWIKFQNIFFDGVAKPWTKWCNTPGVKGTKVTVWLIQFQLSVAQETNTILVRSKLYEGKFDDGVYEKDYAQITLKPPDTPWGREFPWAEIGPLCPYIYRDLFTCQYVGAEPPGQTTCGKSRADCSLRANTINFGGMDMLPAVGQNQIWRK